MKRFGGLFESIASFENLLLAARKAQCCKRFREDVLAFNHDLEPNLIHLQRELLEGTYVHGGYKRFIIFEPKRRIISAAPYRDRVVHHALNNVTEPLFDRSMSESSYANRAGRGTHKALDHFVRGARKLQYCLRADIEKYFPSIDHDILREKIRHKINEEGEGSFVRRFRGLGRIRRGRKREEEGKAELWGQGHSKMEILEREERGIRGGEGSFVRRFRGLGRIRRGG